MRPYFLDLFIFYKTRHWRYAFRKHPVQFISAKAILAVLILLLAAQIVLAFSISGSDLMMFRQLSFGRLFGAGLLMNLARLFYFSTRCQRDIKKGVYFPYPVSGYTLNNMRILEGMFSIFFLISCNLLVLPAFAWSVVFGLAFPLFAILLYLVSQFIYDIVLLLFDKLWLLALTLLFIFVLIPPLKTGFQEWSLVLQRTVPASPGIVIAVLLLVSGIIYFIDTQILIQTSIKRIPHE